MWKNPGNCWCWFLSPVDLFILVSFSLALVDPGRAQDEGKLIWCCRGWSDDLSPSVSPSSRVDTAQIKGYCTGKRYCIKGSTTDCATSWYLAQYYTNPRNVSADCVDPRNEDRTCYCESDWCNCPKVLQGFKTPLPKKPPKCCYGNSNFEDKIEVAQLATDRTVPCLGTVHSKYSNWTDWGSGGNWGSCDVCIERSRLREDCFKWDFKSYDKNWDDDCRCHTDLCNCPLRIKNNETGKGNTTNRGSKLEPAALIEISNFTTQLILFLFFLACTTPTSLLLSTSK